MLFIFQKTIFIFLILFEAFITPIKFVDANTLNAEHNLTVREFKLMYGMKRVRTIHGKEHFAVQSGDIKRVEKKITTKIEIKKFPKGIIRKKNAETKHN